MSNGWLGKFVDLIGVSFVALVLKLDAQRVRIRNL